MEGQLARKPPTFHRLGHVNGVMIYECSVCGNAIVDRLQHKRWHITLIEIEERLLDGS